MLVTLAVPIIAKSGEAMSPSENPPPRQVVSAQQARQGVTGFSIAAVVIVFAIIWIVYFA